MPPEKIDSLADDVKPLVLELLRQNSGLTVRVNELLAQNKALLARIAELEAEHGKPPKTPDNSTRPPSRGRKGNVAEPTRVKKARKGHPGAARAIAENPDATRDIYADRCVCGAALEEAGQELARVWDHVDLPPIKPITTRINLFRATCPCCKARYREGAGRQARGLAVRSRHKGCGRLSARLPDGRLQASDRAVRRPVRPDNLPGRDLQHAGTYGQAVRRGSTADRRHRACQRGDRQRRDQRAREGQDALAMGVRLRHRRLSCDRADARQVRADGLSRRRAAEGVAVGSPAGAVHTRRGAPVLPRPSDP